MTDFDGEGALLKTLHCAISFGHCDLRSVGIEKIGGMESGHRGLYTRPYTFIVQSLMSTNHVVQAKLTFSSTLTSFTKLSSLLLIR